MVAAARRPAVVLVVDDSGVARAAVEGRLRRSGLEVRAVASVAEACAVDPNAVGVALLDLELGDASGVDVALHLRAGAPGFPLAFLTSAPDCALAERARQLGPVFEKGTETDAAVAWAGGRLDLG